MPVVSTHHAAPIVAFDFDGTISDRDSLKDFAAFSLGLAKCSQAYLLSTLPALRWLCGRQTREEVKTAFLQACWHGASQSDLAAQATRYAQTRLTQLVRPEMLARVKAHQALGHRLILVSASPSIYLKPWALSVGFEAVLATELAFSHNIFQGKLATPNCWGPEKVVRLGAWLNEPDFSLTYAYGDSRGDTEMLARAQFPWLRGNKTAMPTL
jgi:phosphatidylglycerophosphatase C